MPVVLLRRLLLLLSISASFLARVSHGQTALHELLDPKRVTASRDSFVVIMQGQPRGWQRLVRRATATGWEFEDAVSVDGMVSQSSRIATNSRLAQQSLHQTGEMSGKPMRIDLTFAKGRVKGVAETPSNPSGPVAIDTTVADGVTDDNALLSLLVAVPWRDSLVVNAPYITSGKGIMERATLRVLGTDSVTVPAGTFDCWRVEMIMGRSRSNVYITRRAPYRVVRVQLGPAFEMQLVR